MTNWVNIFTDLLFYACWDTASENTGLWQLPKVSSAFKYVSSGVRQDLEDIGKPDSTVTAFLQSETETLTSS